MNIDKDIKNEIINFSKSLGFFEIKFSEYKLLTEEIELFKIWLSKNYNASMKWMENNIEKRADARLILENTRTIISLGFNYNKQINHIFNSDFGKISRYAWGDDYHNIIKDKLNKIEEFISNYGDNAKSKSYVDTGPILERQWAANSGLGWTGKNSLLINKKYGSYFFISTILTELFIEPDKSQQDYCGKCNKCVRACPTGAIVEDKVVNSNKCISYWTIESRENEFPVEISKHLNGWLYGCDICQEVCPWNNHRVKISDVTEFNPRNNETSLNLFEASKLTQEEFSIKFKNSPIKRTKVSGLNRNAKILLKTSKNE